MTRRLLLPILALSMLPSLALAERGEPRPDPRTERDEDEEEEIRGRWEWFYGRRGLADGSVSVERARAVRLQAALDVHARKEAQERLRAPLGLWTSIGPSPMTVPGWAVEDMSGRVTTISPDPSSASTLYVGGGSGGFWKTTDGGVTWTNLFERQPTQTIGASDVKASDPREVWVGTGDYNSGCSGYFGAGVFRTTDGGATFDARNGTPPSMFLGIVDGISINPAASGDVVVAGEDECAGGAGQGGIYRTTDGGATWAKVHTGRVHELLRDPSSPLLLYAGTTEAGVLKSTNGGQSWSPANSGINVRGPRWEVAISRSAPQTLYAFNTFGDVYRTTNGGASWTLRGTSACDGQCAWNLTIQVAADAPDTVYLGGVLLYKSIDGGASFQPLIDPWGPTQAMHHDIQDIERHPTDPATVYVGSDGGIWKTPDRGATFTSLNGNLNMTQLYDVGIHPTLDTIVLGGSQDNETEVYTGSTTWEIEEFTGDGMVNLINPLDPSICYVSGQLGSIYRSTSGIGGPYTYISGAITGPCNWVTPYIFDPANPDILFAACDMVWRSTDRGTSWTAVSPSLDGLTISALVAAPSASQVLYAGTPGTVWRTTDGGASWLDVTGNLPSSYVVSDLAVDPADPMHVYVTLGGFGAPQLHYSVTGGTTWMSVTDGVAEAPVNTVLLLSNPARVYVGTDVGILVSASGDAGPYVPDMSGFPEGVPVLDLEYNPATDTITAASYGRGAWQRQASAVELDDVLVGKGAGMGASYDSRINAYRVDGAQVGQVDLLGFTTDGSGANVAGGDLDGDLFGDVLTGQGPGTSHPPVGKAFDRTGAGLPGASVVAYGGTGFGLNLSSSDVDGDASSELLTGPGEGEVYGPQVRAFDYEATSGFTAIAKVNFYAYGTLKYGVNVAGLGYDADAFGEILSGAGPGAVFGPHVRGWQFDGAALTADGRVNFFAYSTLRYGVNPAAADVESDGFQEIIAGAGPGQVFAPAVRAFNADGGTVTAIAKINFFAYGTGRYGVNVAGGDLDGDGYGELATGPGPDATRTADLAGFDYDGIAIAGIPAMTKNVWSGLQYGLTVGTSRLGY